MAVHRNMMKVVGSLVNVSSKYNEFMWWYIDRKIMLEICHIKYELSFMFPRIV